MADRRLPPGPRGWPLVGHTLQYARDPLGFLTRCAREYGDVVRLKVAGDLTYLLVHPDPIEQVLRHNSHQFSKDKGTRLVLSPLGKGLLVSEGDFWRRQRRLAQPAFSSQQIALYAEFMAEASAQMADRWADGQVRNVHADMMHLTMQIVGRTLFGSDVSTAVAEVGGALDAIMGYWADPLNWNWLAQHIPSPARWRCQQAVRRLDRVIYGIIRQRRESGSDGSDLLSRLLAARDEDGRPMTDQQVRDESLTIFVAGHETTAIALACTFYLLAQHRDVAARLMAELDEVLGGRLPTFADVPHLRYTEWVIKESMRLYPPVWSIGREAVEDCEVGGYFVPKGTQMSPVQWIVHHDARWFAEPERFLPERWDHDLARRLPRCAYFPFGDGPRVCIGQQFAMIEMVLVLATIWQRCQVLPGPVQKLRLVPSITLRPAGGIKLTVRRRQVSPKRERRELVDGFIPAGSS